MKEILNNKGQGLIEVMIAIAVIVVGIGGILALTTRSLSSTEKSVKEVIAANLAREGVEMARDVRDSLWLRGQQLSDLIKTVGKVDGTMKFLPALNEWIYNPKSLLGKDPKTDPATILYLDKSTGIYTHDNSLTTNNSGFRRFVTLHIICFYNGSEHVLQSELQRCELLGGGTGVVRGIKAVATVYWYEKGKLKEAKQEEDLYDWYFANPN